MTRNVDDYLGKLVADAVVEVWFAAQAQTLGRALSHAWRLFFRGPAGFHIPGLSKGYGYFHILRSDKTDDRFLVMYMPKSETDIWPSHALAPG